LVVAERAAGLGERAVFLFTSAFALAASSEVAAPASLATPEISRPSWRTFSPM
jgi:hypothetical protein